MIRYDLFCAREHGFEGWFSSSADYDDQCERGLLCCPICENTEIRKAIMAPAVKTARKVEAQSERARMAMNGVAAKIRDEISKNCEHVGDRFAEEARAIHYGEKDARGIYGSVTPEDSVSLAEEGVTAHPLPDVLVPEAAKPKLN